MPYAHPEALVDTDWLAAHLDDPRVRIVDASFTLPGITPTARENYDREHIPGAVFFDIDDIAEPGTSLPHMIPSPDLFAQKIGALGIGDERQGHCLRHERTVFGRAGVVDAAHVRAPDVALLNGGLPKWKSEGRPLTASHPDTGAAPVHRALRPVTGARQGRRSLPICRAGMSRWSTPAPPAALTVRRRKSAPGCAAVISRGAATCPTTG